MKKSPTFQLDELSKKLQMACPMINNLNKILAAVNDPNSSSATLENIFKHDPQFTLKVLALANSAFFGFGGTVTSIRSAIVLLGFDLVRSLTIHAMVHDLFSCGAEYTSPWDASLWQHSVGVGVSAKLLAEQLQAGNAEDFFTIGILHDLGLIIEARFYSYHFRDILETVEKGGRSISEAEIHLFRMDHAALAHAICRRWQIPENLCEPIRCHHAPELATPAMQIPSCILYLADKLAMQNNFGFSTRSNLAVNSEILERLQLLPEDLDGLRSAFQKKMHEAMSGLV